MRIARSLALVLALGPATAAETGLFEVRLGSAASAPNSGAWDLRRPGGAVEMVTLDATVQLDATTIATAEAQRGPDGSPQVRLALTADGTPHAVTRDAAAGRELQGSWSVLSATVGGRLVEDAKLVKATWSFQDGVLSATDGLGQTERFTLSTDPAAPDALRLDPIAPSKERGGWILFRREEDRLTLALYDNLEERPAGFEPAPKKIVMNLARAGRASAAPEPCALLAAAGIRSLLPGGVRQADRERRSGLSACVMADTQGQEVFLIVVPAAGRPAFEAEVERIRKQPRQVVRDEPLLGLAAVSGVHGYTVVFLVLKGETLVIASFQMPPADVTRSREFTRRVLAGVRN
ncbi:MAG: hypothetical protein ABI768_05540 [Acidobacteriota bacterium]